METNQELKLIEGEFVPSEAIDLLINLYKRKIQFHEMKNFSSMERFGVEDEHALTRAAELEKSLKQTSEFILQAEINDKTVEILSIIQLQIKD